MASIAQREPRRDAVVVGAGPAGAIAAMVLARTGLDVLLMDRPRKARRIVGEALPGAASRILFDLGLGSMLTSGAHQTCPGNLVSWGSDSLETLDFIRDPYGPGHHLDRASFDRALRDAAVTAGAELRQGRVRAVRRVGRGFVLSLECGTLHADRLVDASGRSAVLRRDLGVTRHRDAPLLAVCGWLLGCRHPDRRTLLEATSEGWWYTAGLPDGARVAVFHTDSANAARLLASEADWESSIHATRHVRDRLAGGRLEGPLRATDAGGSIVDPPCGRHWVAVGDAAISFDPLAGQGLFTALYTGLRGAQALLSERHGQRDAGAAYASRLASIRARYLDNRAQAYARETRWSDAPFWRGQRGGLSSESALVVG